MLTPGMDRLRTAGPFALIIAMMMVWLWNSVNSFRPLTAPITLSDENSGGAIRQLIFLATAGLSGLMLCMTRSLPEFLYFRLREAAVGALLIGSVVWSTDKTLTIKRSFIFVCGYLAISLAVHMSDRPVRLMQRTLTYFCGAVAWISLLGWFGLPRNCVENPARPGLAGVSNHPNTLAPFLVLGFLISLGLVEPNKRRRQVLRTLQAGMAIGTLLTGSMTSLMMIIVGCGIFFFLATVDYLRGLVQAGAGIVVILVATIGLKNLMEMTLGAMGRDTSLSGRDELWAGVWNEAVKKPFFGHGYGAFWYEGRGREIVVTWNPRQAHNAMLDVFVELGILGVGVALLWFLGTLYSGWLRHATRPGTPQRYAVSGFTTVVLTVLFVFGNSQSFFFKMDSFPFFCSFWCVVLLANSDYNHISAEFELPPEGDGFRSCRLPSAPHPAAASASAHPTPLPR